MHKHFKNWYIKGKDKKPIDFKEEEGSDRRKRNIYPNIGQFKKTVSGLFKICWPNSSIQ